MSDLSEVASLLGEPLASTLREVARCVADVELATEEELSQCFGLPLPAALASLPRKEALMSTAETMHASLRDFGFSEDASPLYDEITTQFDDWEGLSSEPREIVDADFVAHEPYLPARRFWRWYDLYVEPKKQRGLPAEEEAEEKPQQQQQKQKQQKQRKKSKEDAEEEEEEEEDDEDDDEEDDDSDDSDDSDDEEEEMASIIAASSAAPPERRAAARSSRRSPTNNASSSDSDEEGLVPIWSLKEVYERMPAQLRPDHFSEFERWASSLIDELKRCTRITRKNVVDERKNGRGTVAKEFLEEGKILYDPTVICVPTGDLDSGKFDDTDCYISYSKETSFVLRDPDDGEHGHRSYSYNLNEARNCDPNVEWKKMYNGRSVFGWRVLRDVRPGEELLADYGGNHAGDDDDDESIREAPQLADDDDVMDDDEPFTCFMEEEEEEDAPPPAVAAAVAPPPPLPLPRKEGSSPLLERLPLVKQESLDTVATTVPSEEAFPLVDERKPPLGVIIPKREKPSSSLQERPPVASVVKQERPVAVKQERKSFHSIEEAAESIRRIKDTKKRSTVQEIGVKVSSSVPQQKIQQQQRREPLLREPTTTNHLRAHTTLEDVIRTCIGDVVRKCEEVRRLRAEDAAIEAVQSIERYLEQFKATVLGEDQFLFAGKVRDDFSNASRRPEADALLTASFAFFKVIYVWNNERGTSYARSAAEKDLWARFFATSVAAAGDALRRRRDATRRDDFNKFLQIVDLIAGAFQHFDTDDVNALRACCDDWRRRVAADQRVERPSQPPPLPREETRGEKQRHPDATDADANADANAALKKELALKILRREPLDERSTERRKRTSRESETRHESPPKRGRYEDRDDDDDDDRRRREHRRDRRSPPQHRDRRARSPSPPQQHRDRRARSPSPPQQQQHHHRQARSRYDSAAESQQGAARLPLTTREHRETPNYLSSLVVPVSACDALARRTDDVKRQSRCRGVFVLKDAKRKLGLVALDGSAHQRAKAAGIVAGAAADATGTTFRGFKVLVPHDLLSTSRPLSTFEPVRGLEVDAAALADFHLQTRRPHYALRVQLKEDLPLVFSQADLVSEPTTDATLAALGRTQHEPAPSYRPRIHATTTTTTNASKKTSRPSASHDRDDRSQRPTPRPPLASVEKPRPTRPPPPQGPARTTTSPDAPPFRATARIAPPPPSAPHIFDLL